MTRAGSQCLHCLKQIPEQQRPAEFCSPECANEYLKQASSDRHGIPVFVPASLRTVAKTLAVTQRIREQMDASAERRRSRPLALPAASPEPPLGRELPLELPVVQAVTPVVLRRQHQLASAIVPTKPCQVIALATNTPDPVVELHRLSPPSRRAASLTLRGAFSFFPIGDLALIAPVELPAALEGADTAAPTIGRQLEPLERPLHTALLSADPVGISPPLFDASGTPPYLDVQRQVYQDRNGFETSRQIPLLQPAFRDAATTVARLSQRDELMRTTSLRMPERIDQVALNLWFKPSDLEFDFLAIPTHRIREAGARLATSGPARPAPYLVAQPSIPVADLGLNEPSWRRGVMLRVPGFAPKPKDSRRLIKDLAPWFVPTKPKPPAISLEILQPPSNWTRPPGFGEPATRLQESTEPASDLSSLAQALDSAEPGQQKESINPWPRRSRLPIIAPLADWWLTCTNQVRVMVIALPLLLAIALKPLAHGSAGAPSMEERPTAPVRSAHAENPRPGMPESIRDVPQELEARVEKVTKGQLAGFKRAVVTRAAVEMADDFQNGLDNWEGNTQLGPSWSYDRTGFIRPRGLGIFRPSTELSDYAFEFLGKIDQSAVSWVFRASDLRNFYAMKLVDKTGGVTPQMALVHYAVIDGREGPKKEVPLPMTVYKDTLFRIRMDIQGPHFSVQVQGTVVDYWKDSRLKSGGIGFFAARGEESRVRWVQLTHHDDVLGKLCAFLSPYAM